MPNSTVMLMEVALTHKLDANISHNNSYYLVILSQHLQVKNCQNSSLVDKFLALTVALTNLSMVT
jgi:hypothetical protein